MIHFELRGEMVSGKNQQKIRPLPGGGYLKYPNARFKLWRNTMAKQIWQQRRGLSVLFPEKPVVLYVDYYPADLIRRDMTGILDSLFHLFETCKIVANDSQIKHCTWNEAELDRANPRTIIDIDEWH